MGGFVHPSLIGLVVRHLPRPLVRLLDAWSEGVARRRWAQRQQKWQQRKTAAAAPVETGVDYRLRPWRD